MTLTTSFKQSQLLDTFNQAVCKRMAEEHAFIKTLDEIFQAQGQEIVRYEEEVQRLRRLLSAANTKIAELSPGEEVVFGEQQPPPESSTSPSSIEQSYTNEVYKPRAETAILQPKKQWLADHTPNSAQSTSDEEFPTAIVPHITIKEEMIDDDSDTNPFPESEGNTMDDNEMAGSSSGNSNQSNDGDEMTAKRKRNTSTSTFECPFCQKSYSLWSAMKRRVVLDNGQKVFTCRYCKEAHNLMKSSHAYKKSPNHKRPYKCSVSSLSHTHTQICLLAPSLTTHFWHFSGLQ